jgi:cytochrome c biogenesis protein CcdA
MPRRLDPATLPVTAYWLLPMAVALVSLAGYSGYLLYPRFDLSSAQGIGLLALAAAAGIAAFFSPCSFPLLVTLLSASAQKEAGAARRSSPLVFAMAMAAGAALFLTVMGLLIAAGGSAIFSGITFASTEGRVIRAVAGVALALLGLMQLGVIAGPDFHRLQAFTSGLLEPAPGEGGVGSLAGPASYGFGYVLAGVG